MIILQKENIHSITGIVYFKNDLNHIFALANTHSNLYSYMSDLSSDAQEFLNDLAKDTQEDEGVFIYSVNPEMLVELGQFLSSNFERVNRYEWIEESRIPQLGDFLYLVSENNDETPYIISLFQGDFTLINLRSGRSHHSGDTIDELIEVCLSFEKSSAEDNPIMHYYFVANDDTQLSHNESFGFSSI